MDDVRHKVKFPMSEIIRQSDELQAAIARGEGPDPARLYVPRPRRCVCVCGVFDIGILTVYGFRFNRDRSAVDEQETDNDSIDLWELVRPSSMKITRSHGATDNPDHERRRTSFRRKSSGVSFGRPTALGEGNRRHSRSATFLTQHAEGSESSPTHGRRSSRDEPSSVTPTRRRGRRSSVHDRSGALTLESALQVLNDHAEMVAQQQSRDDGPSNAIVVDVCSAWLCVWVCGCSRVMLHVS